jgi:hypothetical protein
VDLQGNARRALGPARIPALLGQDREAMGQRLLTRLRFADVLNGVGMEIWLKMQGVAKQGKGILQLGCACHTDEAGKEPFRKPYRLYTIWKWRRARSGSCLTFAMEQAVGEGM